MTYPPHSSPTAGPDTTASDRFPRLHRITWRLFLGAPLIALVLLASAAPAAATGVPAGRSTSLESWKPIGPDGDDRECRIMGIRFRCGLTPAHGNPRFSERPYHASQNSPSNSEQLPGDADGSPSPLRERPLPDPRNQW